jgi:hypothetical protein
MSDVVCPRCGKRQRENWDPVNQALWAMRPEACASIAAR